MSQNLSASCKNSFLLFSNLSHESVEKLSLIFRDAIDKQEKENVFSKNLKVIQVTKETCGKTEKCMLGIVPNNNMVL